MQMENGKAKKLLLKKMSCIIHIVILTLIAVQDFSMYDLHDAHANLTVNDLTLLSMSVSLRSVSNIFIGIPM